MRCRPGDLAIFLPAGDDPCSIASRGAIVTVDQHHTEFGMVHWSLRQGQFVCGFCGLRFTYLPYADLQPLRPGPDKANTSDSLDVRDGVVAHG